MQYSDHQRAFAEFMRSSWERQASFGTILGDPAGTGKTRSVWAAIEQRHALRRGKRPRYLVVCVLGQEDFWRSECSVFSKAEVFHYHNMTKRRREAYESSLPAVVLTNIHTLAAEYVKCASYYTREEEPVCGPHGPELTEYQRSLSPLFDTTWDLVVMDEPTYLSHPFWAGASRMYRVANNMYRVTHSFSRACYNLQYSACVLVNGNRVRNKLTDVAGYVYMVLRGTGHAAIDCDWWADESPAEPVGESMTDGTKTEKKQWVAEPLATRVKMLLDTCVYKSGQVPPLPVALHTRTYPLPLSDQQTTILSRYRLDAQAQFRRWLADPVHNQYESVWKRVMDMLVCCLSPELLRPSCVLKDSPKLHFLVTDLIPSLLRDETQDNQQIVVFSRSRAALDMLGRYLEIHWPTEFAEPALSLRAGQTVAQRTQVLCNFRSHALARDKRKKWSRRIMLCTYHFGHSFNLQQGCHVVLLDRAWNPSVEIQAIKRCYRMGQTRDVTVYRMHMNSPCSPERWLHALHAQKGVIMTQAGEGTELMHTDDESWQADVPAESMFQFLFGSPHASLADWKRGAKRKESFNDQVPKRAKIESANTVEPSGRHWFRPWSYSFEL